MISIKALITKRKITLINIYFIVFFFTFNMSISFAPRNESVNQNDIHYSFIL